MYTLYTHPGRHIPWCTSPIHTQGGIYHGVHPVYTPREAYTRVIHLYIHPGRHIPGVIPPVIHPGRHIPRVIPTVIHPGRHIYQVYTQDIHQGGIYTRFISQGVGQRGPLRGCPSSLFYPFHCWPVLPAPCYSRLMSERHAPGPCSGLSSFPVSLLADTSCSRDDHH